MDIFDIDPNALIILVIMIIGGLKWMMERMKGEQPDEDDQFGSGTPFQDLYEEARREIKQRQGGPPAQDSSRPVAFAPLSHPPPGPATPPPLPTAARTSAPESSPYQQRSVTRAALSAAEEAALKRLKTQGLAGRRKRRGSTRSNVHRLLSSPAATRDAIVLREILGPPKGAAQGLVDS